MLARYATLTEDEIKTLVVKDKWFASIQSAIESEVQRLTQALTGARPRTGRTLRNPLPALAREVEGLEGYVKVAAHLRNMGMIGNDCKNDYKSQNMGNVLQPNVSTSGKWKR